MSGAKTQGTPSRTRERSRTVIDRDTQTLQQREFDILVIGGGITGVCIAHDAALRGMRVALVEKRDFGWFTSSASSKLLHGGIRYLPHGQFRKVRESARERFIFQCIAPHLTYYLPFVVPVFKGDFMKSAFAMKTAMKLYDSICAGLKQSDDPAKKIPATHFLNRHQLIKLIPVTASLDNLTGGQVLYESHMRSSERMTLAFVKTAVANGAVAANYVEVQSLIKEGDQVTGAHVLDKLSGERFTIRAGITVNAAGPFIQGINEQHAGLKLARRTTGFSKGVHLVTRKLIDHYAIALSTSKRTEGMINRGGRHIFILPWRDRSLIGTTNVPFSGELDDVRVTHADIMDFLEDINQTLPAVDLQLRDVRYAFSGLYPLTAKEIRTDTYQGTGDYQIIDHARDGVQGVITALGAKYTTAREVAERVTDLLARKSGRSWRGCTTATTQLVGGEVKDWTAFVVSKSRKYKERIDPELLSSLLYKYGTEIDEVIEPLLTTSSSGKIPDSEILAAEVNHAVKHEMARSVSDMVFRRSGLGTIGHPGKDILTRVAVLMAELLGWDQARIRSEIQEIEAAYQCLQQ
jgi:glycerol-3-phosphate dehydrogenase